MADRERIYIYVNSLMSIKNINLPQHIENMFHLFFRAFSIVTLKLDNHD